MMIFSNDQQKAFPDRNLSKTALNSFWSPHHPWFIFLLFASYGPSIQIIGQLRFTEAILLLIGAFHAKNIWRSTARNELFFAGLFVFTAFCYGLFDFINQGITATTLKKIGTYGLLSLEFLIITWMIDKRSDRIFAALLGFCLSFVIVMTFKITIPNNSFHDHPWLVGLGEALTIIPLVLIAALPRHRLYFFSILLVVTFFHLYYGSRNLSLTTFALWALVAFAALFGSRQPKPFSWPKFLQLAVISGAGLALLITGFFVLLKGAAMPDPMAQKLTRQMDSEFSVVVTARPDVAAAMIGITKKPLLGYGSGLVDDEVFDNYAKFSSGGHYSIYIEVINHKPTRDSNPSHSHLFGAWLDAGFIAAISWVMVVIFCLRLLVIFSYFRSPIMPLTVFIAMSTIWDILFSPGPNRVEMSLALVFLFLVLYKFQYTSSSAEAKPARGSPKGK